jgi:hypothetical protein
VIVRDLQTDRIISEKKETDRSGRDVSISVTIAFPLEMTGFRDETTNTEAEPTDFKPGTIGIKEETTEINGATAVNYNREIKIFSREHDSHRRAKPLSPGNAKIRFASYPICK